MFLQHELVGCELISLPYQSKNSQDHFTNKSVCFIRSSWKFTVVALFPLQLLVLDSAESLILQVKNPAKTLLIMTWRHMIGSGHF